MPGTMAGHNTGLTQVDIDELTAWRRDLHRRPELAGQEAETAATVQRMLDTLSPDKVLTGLGGHGVAAVFDSGQPGPAVLLRCELDGLPIHEIGDLPYRSEKDGHGHLCGHDGHMSWLAGMARLLSRQRPARGRVILMFQPAEEDGAGAARVVADPAFAQIAPDYAFAIHNMPGMPLGDVALDAGPVTCASAGMHVSLTGRTAHASLPETGISPAPALAQLMPALTALGHGQPKDHDFTLVTITHARMGEPAFGVAPGQAELFATLRTRTDNGMEALRQQAEALARDAADACGLTLSIGYEDVFVTCNNDATATDIARRALDRLGAHVDDAALPLRGSEDFGRFGAGANLAFMLLGAGEGTATIHNPDYDFPDALITPGVRIFAAIVDEILG